MTIGCGFGDTTQRIAGMVGPEGEAVGVDVSPRFIRTAIDEANAGGVDNVRFQPLDVETAELGGPYDLAFSRFGTMFFAGPVTALRNVRSSLVPAGSPVLARQPSSPASLGFQITSHRCPSRSRK